MNRTYIRIFNSIALSKIFIWGFLKKIVTFYCNFYSYNYNIFKNSENVPINYLERTISPDFINQQGSK